MARLLELRIARSALRHGGGMVTRNDLKFAIGRLLDETPAGVLSIYTELCKSFEDMPNVLRMVANAGQDAHGCLKIGIYGKNLPVGSRRLSTDAWSKLIAFGVLSQPLGHTDASINNRPLIYHVQLLSARDNFDVSQQQF